MRTGSRAVATRARRSPPRSRRREPHRYRGSASSRRTGPASSPYLTQRLPLPAASPSPPAGTSRDPTGRSRTGRRSGKRGGSPRAWMRRPPTHEALELVRNCLRLHPHLRREVSNRDLLRTLDSVQQSQARVVREDLVQADELGGLVVVE